MVPFTPCTWVCLGSIHWSHLHPVLLSVVGSNPRSDVLPVLVIKSMVSFTPCTCDQIHGPIYTLYLWSNPWSHLHPAYTCDQIHGPIYTLYLCLLWGQMHGPIYTLYVCLLWGMKSMVPFTPCTCVCCGVKCMVPFTPYTFVCFGVESMVPFTPCT